MAVRAVRIETLHLPEPSEPAEIAQSIPAPATTSDPTPVTVPDPALQADLQEFFLRPPHPYRYQRIVVEHDSVRLEIAVNGNVELIKALFKEACGEFLKAAVWNAGLRSRRVDGQGYINVVLIDAVVVIDAVINGCRGDNPLVPNSIRFTVPLCDPYNGTPSPSFDTVEESHDYHYSNTSFTPGVGIPFQYGAGYYRVT